MEKFQFLFCNFIKIGTEKAGERYSGGRNKLNKLNRRLETERNTRKGQENKKNFGFTQMLQVLLANAEQMLETLWRYWSSTFTYKWKVTTKKS